MRECYQSMVAEHYKSIFVFQWPVGVSVMSRFILGSLGGRGWEDGYITLVGA